MTVYIANVKVEFSSIQHSYGLQAKFVWEDRSETTKYFNNVKEAMNHARDRIKERQEA